MADETSRTGLREDAVITEVQRFLDGHPDGTVRVIDVCCGYGTLARHLAAGLGATAKRVEYLGVDENHHCVKRVRKNAGLGEMFAGFECRTRDAWDCPSEWAGTAHLVVLNNALHELPPHRYPELFDGLNRLLAPKVGRVCVVDMESLPAGEPEAVAINWARTEVEQWLKAGGLGAGVTAHPKGKASVFLAQVPHSDSAIDARGMLTAIRKLLGEKLAATVRSRQAMDDGFPGDAEQLMHWVVLTGTAARLAEELLAVDARIDQLPPTGSPLVPPAT